MMTCFQKTSVSVTPFVVFLEYYVHCIYRNLLFSLDEVPQNLHAYSCVRRKVYDVVSHYKFDLAIAIVIGLNVVFMAVEFYQMPAVSLKLIVVPHPRSKSPIFCAALKK